MNTTIQPRLKLSLVNALDSLDITNQASECVTALVAYQNDSAEIPHQKLYYLHLIFNERYNNVYADLKNAINHLEVSCG